MDIEPHELTRQVSSALCRAADAAIGTPEGMAWAELHKSIDGHTLISAPIPALGRFTTLPRISRNQILNVLEQASRYLRLHMAALYVTEVALAARQYFPHAAAVVVDIEHDDGSAQLMRIYNDNGEIAWQRPPDHQRWHDHPGCPDESIELDFPIVIELSDFAVLPHLGDVMQGVADTDTSHGPHIEDRDRYLLTLPRTDA